MTRSLWLLLLLSSSASTLYALPQNGQVAAGQATIFQPAADTLTINQTSSRAVLNWQGFDVGANESVLFNLPDANSISLNRVLSGGASLIDGSISSNGQLYLLNPQGVMFGAGSIVNVGGLMATTAHVTDDMFMNGGPLTFTGGAGRIVHNGTLNIADGGYALLAAPTVVNNGTITARLGTIQLAGISQFTLDPVGDGLLALAPNPAAMDVNVTNTGMLSANGGVVALSTQQTEAAFANVVNTTGQIEANTFENRNGHIVLGSAPTQRTLVGGTVTANGNDNTQTGGVVDVVGGFVSIQNGARLAADGINGGGAIHVGGNAHGTGVLPNAQTTVVATGAVLSADAVQTGHGGEIVVWADGTTAYGGLARARGGAQSGNGGFIEVSGKHNLLFRGLADTSAAHGVMGHLLLDPIDIIITDGSGGADDAQVSDGIILAAENALGNYTISENSLEGLLATTNISLEATDDITMNNLSDDVLSLSSTGTVTFFADSDLDGSGGFAMNSGDAIQVVGADLTIKGSTIQLGTITTAATGASGGNITLDTSTGTGAITLNGNLTTNGGNVDVDGVVTLANNVAISTGAGGGAITFDDAISGDFTLNLIAGTLNAITLDGVDVDTLTLTSANSLNIGGVIQTDTAQNYSSVGSITLTADTTFSAFDGSAYAAFTQGVAMNGGFNVIIDGSTLLLTSAGLSTRLASLDAEGHGGTVTIGATRTTGNQTFTGTSLNLGDDLNTTGGDITLANNVTLTNDVNLTASGGGSDITVGGTVNGTHALASMAGQNVTFGGAVGGSSPLTTFTSTAGAAGSYLGVVTSGGQTYSGPSTLNGTYTASGGNFTMGGAVTLGGTTNVNTSAANNDITFASTINGANNLTLNAGTGDITVSGASGGSTPLGAFTATGATIAVGGMTTTNAQTYTGVTTLNGNVTSNNAALTFNGNTILGANSVLTSGGGSGDDISIVGTLTGAHNATFNAGATGDVYLLGTTITGLTLTGRAFYVGGNITTTGNMDFTGIGDINLTANRTLAAGSGNIIMDSGNTLLGAFNLTASGDTLTLGGVSGLNQLTLMATTANILANSISTNGAVAVNGATQLGTTITTTGDNVTFANATTLTANSAISTAGGAVAFSSILNGAFDLVVSSGAGAISFGGVIGGVTPLADLTLTTTNTFASSGALSLTGDLAVTASNITLSGATSADDITLTGPSTVAANMTAGGDIAVNGTSTFTGVTTAGNDITLVGASSVGAGAMTATAGDITITGNSILTGNLMAGDDLMLTGTVSLGSNLTAGGNIAVTGATTLTANSTVTGGGGVNDTVTLTGNIGGDRNLTIANTLGDITMTGNVDINTLTFSSGDYLYYGGGTLEADTGLDFSALNGIYLSGDTSFYGRDGSTRSDVNAGTGNAILATTTGIDLTVFGDLVTLYEVGDNGSGKLQTLTVDATTAQMLGNIFTTGAQTITAQQGLAGFLNSAGGDIVLNTTATLVGDINIQSNGGNVYINQPLTGAYDMLINAGIGDVFFNAALGSASAPLTSMDVTAAHITINSPVTTSGPQSYTGLTNLSTILTIGVGDIVYHDAVTLTGNSTIDTSQGNGTIRFNDPVNGGYDLTLRAGSLGTIVFADEAGATGRLGTLTVESTRDITFDQGVYAMNYNQNVINGLAYFGYAPGLDVTNNISVAVSQNLEGRFTGRAISLEAGGLVRGDIFASESFTLNSGSSILNGTIHGDSARDAISRIAYERLSGGPHYFSGQNLPIVDSFYVLPQSNAETATLAFTTAFDAVNPFGSMDYLVAEAGVLDDETETP